MSLPFSDERSQAQISAYLTYRNRAADERNQRAASRWNEHLRQQWELEHVESPRLIEDQPDTWPDRLALPDDDFAT